MDKQVALQELGSVILIIIGFFFGTLATGTLIDYLTKNKNKTPKSS